MDDHSNTSPIGILLQRFAILDLRSVHQFHYQQSSFIDHNVCSLFHCLIISYSISFFFSNFGPGTTTFLLPAAVFPIEIRSTMNGFAAALGKVGAAIGAYGYEALVEGGGKESTV